MKPLPVSQPLLMTISLSPSQSIVLSIEDRLVAHFSTNPPGITSMQPFSPQAFRVLVALLTSPHTCPLGLLVASLSLDQHQLVLLSQHVPDPSFVQQIAIQTEQIIRCSSEERDRSLHLVRDAINEIRSKQQGLLHIQALRGIGYTLQPASGPHGVGMRTERNRMR